MINGTKACISEALDEVPPGASSLQTCGLLINNIPHKTTDSFAVFSPSTGEFLYNFSSASVADTEVAISSAQAAFPKWRSLSPAKKRDIFLKTATIMEDRRERLTNIMVQETGAAVAWAHFNVDLAIDMLKDVAGRISGIAGTIPTCGEEGTSALIYKEPYGIILGIAPWNAPFILGMRSVAYPLAAGNTAILKAPELSPMCSHAIVSAFHSGGLPSGVLSLVAHSTANAATITEHLISHPYVKKINFTGSTLVGRILGELAGKHIKPILLELGGKAPAIVWEDADLKLAAQECAIGAFLNSGQVCMSTERIIVHNNVAKEFEMEFKKAVAAFAPLDKEAGVLINKASVEKNQRLLDDAIGKGAILLFGEQANDGDSGVARTRMRPTAVKGTNKNMDMFYTESFGPMVSLFEVDSEEEALRLANDTEYGLTAAIFTSNLQRGLRFAKSIESGAVHINGMTIHDEAALPHGGMKSSGFGRFGSAGLESFLRTKTVTFRD